ncbi:MAG TPA: SLC13 family permease, partial [Planctomycetota bacterium]|nr:SLC13 family permease [Planctomycetota bacterium]
PEAPRRALAVFVLAWALIAARRFRFLPIGRPTGALLGAVLMVLLGVLAPKEAYAAVDGDTIALLFGMMVLQVEFDRSGLLDALASRVAARAGSAARLLSAVVVASGLLSALLVNDAVCLMAAPLVARMCTRAALPPLPYLLALATGSNVGGVMTLTGTPQCMIVGSLSGMSWTRYASVMAPTGLVLLLLSAAFFHVAFRRALPKGPIPAVPSVTPLDPARARRFGWTVAAVLAGFVAGLPIAWVALAGACLTALLRFGEPKENLARLDWPLLLFFASLFVVIGGVAKAGWVDLAADRLSAWLTEDPSSRPWPFAAFSVAASNVLSNVPFVLVVGQGYPGAPDAFWYQLALTSTLAGNLTLVGSVANLIVAEAAAREGVEVGFLDYLKVGVPLTLLTTAAGLVVLALFGYA